MLSDSRKIYILWREEQTTDTVGVASGLGEALLNRNNKIVSKGDEVSKITGIWCPRRAARVVKEGQCSGRKSPGKGRSPAGRTRSPLRSGARGAAASPAASSSFGPRRFQGLNGPASWPISRLTGAALDPSTLPSWTHGEETGLPRRGALGI